MNNKLKPLAALILTIAGWAPVSQAEPILLDRIAAIAENDVVMTSELSDRLKQVKEQLAANGTQLPPGEQLHSQVLERLIVENLLLQRAERAGVRISDEELSDSLGQIAKQNGMTLSEFRQRLAADGLSYIDTREQIRREMIITRIQQGVVNGRIQVSAQEIDNFINSEEGKQRTAPDYHLAHILLPYPPSASEEQITQVDTQASNLFTQINQGVDFAQLAAANSAGQTALQGGDLGWRKLGQLPSLFAPLIKQLQVGESTAPIKTGNGVHLLKLVEKRGAIEKIIAQTKSRHILIKPSEIRSQAEAKVFIEELRQRIDSGEDFASVAREYSEDSASAVAGGDLGWMSPGMLVPEYEAVINAQQPGQISKPFLSPFGWHIVEVLERREQDMSEQFLRNRAENLLRRRKFDEELDIWLRELRSEAFVEVKI